MAPDRSWGGTLCPLTLLGFPTTERPVRLGAWRADQLVPAAVCAVGRWVSGVWRPGRGGGPQPNAILLPGRNSAPCVVDGHATASVCS